jgi:hypothetical protein
LKVIAYQAQKGHGGRTGQQDCGAMMPGNPQLSPGSSGIAREHANLPRPALYTGKESVEDLSVQMSGKNFECLLRAAEA